MPSLNARHLRTLHSHQVSELGLCEMSVFACLSDGLSYMVGVKVFFKLGFHAVTLRSSNNTPCFIYYLA